MQWVFFVGPCVVRYFVGSIVYSQLGWGNSREYRKEMCESWFHAAGYNPHGIIQGYVQLLVWELRLHTGVAYSALL